METYYQDHITLYKSLDGSIIGYSYFIIHNLSQGNEKKLQAMALRSIFRKPFDSITIELCQLGKMSTVEERLVSMNKALNNIILVVTSK